MSVGTNSLSHSNTAINPLHVYHILPGDTPTAYVVASKQSPYEVAIATGIGAAHSGSSYRVVRTGGWEPRERSGRREGRSNQSQSS